MTKLTDYPHLLRKNWIKDKQSTFHHPWNPKSEVTGTHMSRIAGLTRTGVSLVHIPPGKESFTYHLHHREEEWIYILSGRAMVRIDDRDYPLEAGDFVAFPTPSVAHNLANPHDEELVYLMGGESLDYEIADFPDHGKRIVRLGDEITVYRLEDGKPFFEPEA